MNTSQIVREPTRNSYILDFIFTNNADKILSSKEYDAALADHMPTERTIKFDKPKRKHKTIIFRNFKNVKIKSFVSSFDNSFMTDTCPQEFTQKLLNCYDKHAPLRRKKIVQKDMPLSLSPRTTSLIIKR